MIKKLLFSFLLANMTLFSMAQEICGNLIDDDNDGLVDQKDIMDCPCHIAPEGMPSMIPNPSFEELDCLPGGVSELNCAIGWNQATLATSDLYSLNSFMPTVIPHPLDGNNCVGTISSTGYQEYIGACLEYRMTAGQSYSMSFDLAYTTVGGFIQLCGDMDHRPVEIALYGSADCQDFPINSYGCPGDLGWNVLGLSSYEPQTAWKKVTIIFTPSSDIETIILGTSCNLPPFYGIACFNYFIWDNLQLLPVEQTAIYYVPNAFTPDGNELNQYFTPVFTCGIDPAHYEFKVYNIWGEVIFSSFDPQVGWDGTYLGKMMQQGIYTWTIRYKEMSTDNAEILTGHMSLLR